MSDFRAQPASGQSPNPAESRLSRCGTGRALRDTAAVAGGLRLCVRGTRVSSARRGRVHAERLAEAPSAKLCPCRVAVSFRSW